MIMKLALLLFFFIVTISPVRPDDLYEVMRAYWDASPEMQSQPCAPRENIYQTENDGEEDGEELPAANDSWELGTNDSEVPTEVIIDPYQ